MYKTCVCSPLQCENTEEKEQKEGGIKNKKVKRIILFTFFCCNFCWKLLQYTYMIITKEHAQPFTIPGGTEGVLYPSDSNGAFTLARVTTAGVYPQKGYSVNDVATETIFVLQGMLDIEVDGTVFHVTEGNFISVKPGQKYRIEGKAECIDVITPAWEKNHNRIIDV